MPLYIVTGISGSGKTTVARELVKLGHVALDSKLNPGLFGFSEGKWTINGEVFDRLVAEHPASTPLFLCGGGDSLKAYWPKAQKVFFLQVDQQTMIKRLLNPSRDNQFGRTDEARGRLVRRLDGYQANQLAAGAIPINAKQPIGDVVHEILGQSSS